MHFHEIAAADLPRLFAIRTAARENAVTREWLTATGITEQTVAVMLATTHRGWLCEVQGEPVGFAIGNGSNGELWVIAVLPAHEGKGIGRALMQLTQDWLWSKGWNELWLVTGFDPNARATHLYRELGWKDAGVRDEQRLLTLKRPEGV